MTNQTPKTQENKPSNKKPTKIKVAIAILLIILLGSAIYVYKQNELAKKNPNVTSKPEVIYVKRKSKLYNEKKGFAEVIKAFNKHEFITFCERYPKNCKLNNIKEPSKQFSHKFINSIKTNKNIEVIEPTVVTNNFNSKKLASYLKKCPKFKKYLNVLPHCFQYCNKDEVYALNHYTIEEQLKHGFELDDFASNFLLYDIDFDNNPHNGKQGLLYRSGFSMWNYAAVHADYMFVNFNKCREYHENLFIQGGAGVIKYNNKYYIYEASSASGKFIDFIKFYTFDSIKFYNSPQDHFAFLVNSSK